MRSDLERNLRKFQQNTPQATPAAAPASYQPERTTYPATFDEYLAQRNAQRQQPTYPATFDEYMAQREEQKQEDEQRRQQEERQKCLEASGFTQMQADMNTMFGGMDAYLSQTKRKDVGNGRLQQVQGMLEAVEQEKDYFNRYADVLGDTTDYQAALEQWEQQLRGYEEALGRKRTLTPEQTPQELLTDNPLTGKKLGAALTGLQNPLTLTDTDKDGQPDALQVGYTLGNRKLTQRGEALSGLLQQKAERADWNNQTVQDHEKYIRESFENLKQLTDRGTTTETAKNLQGNILNEVAERLSYLAYSGKCTEEEYEKLVTEVEKLKKDYLKSIRSDTSRLPGNPEGNPYLEISGAAGRIQNRADAMKEFRYQNSNLTRENIAYQPVDKLLDRMHFTYSKDENWGSSSAERAAITFMGEEVLPEYLANTEMTQEQYKRFLQQIKGTPNEAALRRTRESNGLNANEEGKKAALEKYREIDGQTYMAMFESGSEGAMHNVMEKYPGGAEQVLTRGLGYVTKFTGEALNMFGENDVGNWFKEGGQKGIDYVNEDWQAGKQREYDEGRYASDLLQNGNKFEKWTAGMTRELTQAALEMASAGAIAGQISAGNTALAQLSQGGKYASSLANAQKHATGYMKFTAQMAELMKNSSNIIISANAALNSYGEAEDAGMGAEGRAIKLIAGGLIEYYTNGLFGGNPVVDPDGAGALAKKIYELTDNETIRKIVSSKAFDRVGEGLEEVTSAIAGAALDYALTGETSLSAEELVNEFTVGVLLSMVMSAPEDVVDAVARAKNSIQSKVVTKFGKDAQTNLETLYGTMVNYTMKDLAGDESMMRLAGWSDSQIRKAKSEWQTAVREFNTLANRLEGNQSVSDSFTPYTPPEGYASNAFEDVEYMNAIRANQASDAALMTDRALDIATIQQRMQIESLRNSTDAGDIFQAENAQSYLDILDRERSYRQAERAQTAQEAPQAAQETAQSAAATVEQAEEINAPAAQETEGGMSNEQSQSVNENQERNERVGAEGQTGGVVESGSRIAADRGGTGEGGGNESENLRRQKLNERVERFKGTVLDTGMDKLTADGDPDVMVGIVPVRKYTQAMKQAQREAKEQGVKTTFVVGTMSIKGEDGEYHNTDAMFDAESGRIFVSVSSIYEPEVLMEHELFHAKVHAAEIDLVTALESVSENMTAEEYTEIVEQYMKAYRGAYDSDAAVYEEILADAYAGLNRFVNRSFKKLIDAMRTHAAGMQSQRESSAPTAEVSRAVRRTQDGDGNEKTARRGGTRASIDRYSYQGKSMTENSEIYSYDFLTHQPDMKVVELPALDSVKTNGKIDKEKTVAHGIENAKAIGEGMSDTVASVTNLYTGRKILISKRALLHGLYGDNISRLRTNARISALAGDVISSAIPVNALSTENDQALGTYAMVSIASAGEGKTVAIITTVEQHTNKFLNMESIDIAHALSGRMVKKEGSLSSTRDGDSPETEANAATFTLSIADVIQIVNTTHQSILSDDVLKVLGEERNPEGYYAERVKFSLSQQTDEEYNLAVRSGDMEKAQEMVEAAAKKAGYTIHAYHGTARADRVGTEFREDRATSGPMAFFTDSKKIAGNYARDKADTSLAYDEEYDDYYTQFRVTRNGKSLAIGDLWNYLTIAERMKIKNAAPHIRFDDDYDQILYDPSAQHGNGAYDAYELNRNKGNVLNTLISTWLETGDLYDREGDFLEVLKLAGLNDVEYRDPNTRHEKVYDVFLKIKNPFDASNAEQSFYEGLSEWLENTDISEYQKESAGADMWDKNRIEPERFLKRLADDIEAGTSNAWTSIPDYVTAYLKELGYDGIKDVGGKGGGGGHTVWIPFTGKQVKSAEAAVYTDDGELIPLSQRFKANKRDIRYSLTPTEKAQRAQERAETAAAKAEEAKQAAQESYKRELTGGMKKLFEVQSYDNEALGKLLEAPMAEMQQGVKLLKAEKDDLFEALMNLGTATLPADDYYREIREALRGRRIFVPEGIREDFGDDWGDFRKKAFSSGIYFTDKASDRSVDVHMLELADAYPSEFTEEYIASEMLRQIVDAAEKGKDARMSLRKGMEENEKRFGLKREEQLEYQRQEFEKLLNQYERQAGAEAREAQATTETDERLASLIREVDGEKAPAKKTTGPVEPWTISEAAAQKRGFPNLNGRQVYPLRTWVKAADMGNYGLVLDKSTKKGMLTVLFQNKETGLASIKDIATKDLTAVDATYQPSVQETASLLASIPAETLEDAADAQDVAEFYEWYDGRARLADAEEKARTRAAAEQERKDSIVREEEKAEARKQERLEGVRKAYLESFGTSEPELPYGKGKPLNSRGTTLQPAEALALLQAMTGKKWTLTNKANGTWKATITKEDAPKSSIQPKDALEKLQASRKNYSDFAETAVRPEGVPKEAFEGSPAMQEAGIKIDGGIAEYSQVKQMRNGAETRRSIQRQIEKTKKRLEAKPVEIRAAKKIASGRSEYYKLPDNCRPEVVSQLSALYLNERMTGEDLIQIRKGEIRAALLYKMIDLFPTEKEIQANPELFKPEKLLVLNYRTALRSMINIFGEERGMEIYNYLFAPVIRNTAESFRWESKQFDAVREFEDSKGKKTELTETEYSYVHMMLDVMDYVEQANDSDRSADLKAAAENVAKGASASDQAIEFGLSSEEAKIVEKYAQWINGKDTEGIDKVKCENAMKEYRKLFDLYFELSNDLLVAHGMQPIGKIKGYTPHIPLAEKFNLMSKAMEVLGMNEYVTTLPAEIAGRTETFRPQKRWNPFYMERTTDKTEYHIGKAFQSYVQYLGDILFHTDDIMKIRAAESYLRQGLRGNFDVTLEKALDMSRSGDIEEKVEYLQEMGKLDNDMRDYSQGELAEVFDGLISELIGEAQNSTRYSDLVVWLKNYGDILAGKQFGGDRGTEYGGGREWLNIGNKLVGAFAKANVAGNLSSVLNQSAQLAMLQATRSQRAILKATQEFCTGKLGEFRKEIDFLTGKKGIDYLVQNKTDKIVSGMFAPAEFMDSMLSTIATRAAYWDAIQNGKSETEALRYADWYGRALMGDRTKGAKPLAFHSKGLVRQMVNVFQLEALNTVEFTSKDMPLEIRREAEKNGNASAARMLLRTIFGYLIAAFVLNRLTDELYGGTPAPLDIAGLTANFFASGKGLSTNDYIRSLINKVVGSKIFDVPEENEKFDTSAALEDTGYNVLNEIPFASNISSFFGVGDRTLPFPNLYGTGKNFVNAIFPGEGKNANGQEVLEKGLEFLAELVPGGRQAKKTGYGIKALLEGGKTKGYGDNRRLQYSLDMDNPMTYVKALLFGVNSTSEAKAYYAANSSGLTADQTKLWMELRDEGVNGFALYGLMMRMDDAMNYSDIPDAKDDETEADKAKRLQMKEEKRKAARAELLKQEGLTDGQRMRIYSEMVSSYNDDQIEKLISAGMKWKDVSDILDKRGELSAGKSSTEWAAEFANWVDKKGYSDSRKEAIQEVFGSDSASFYNKMSAAGVSPDNALKVEKQARKLAGENDLSQKYKAQAIAESNLTDKEAYAALSAVYTSSGETLTAAQEAGIPGTVYAKFRAKESELSADKDENGKTISDSKKEKVIDLIDGLNLTAEQKDFLMEQQYKSFKWWQMPWN